MSTKKTVKTLEKDVRHVARTGEGFTEEIAHWVGDVVGKSVQRQLVDEAQPRGNLRFSSLGTPCSRKLWHSVNSADKSLPLSYDTKNKFIFGDIIEALALGYCKASGHDVTGLQDRVEILGVRGSRDCIIDGMVFDVKSTSTRGVSKFINNGLREDDPFGYLSQLSSYLYGSLDDESVTYKDKAGFIAIDKQFGGIYVDIYDLSDYLGAIKEEEVKKAKSVVSQSKPPPIPYDPVPIGKSGNKGLALPCRYCDFKHLCYPEARVFQYSSGPMWLVEVNKEPNVMEIT